MDYLLTNTPDPPHVLAIAFVVIFAACLLSPALDSLGEWINDHRRDS